MSTVEDTLHTMGELVVEVVNGLFVERRVYITAYLDGFGVDSSDLTADHRQTLDRWIAGDTSSVFPVRPGRSDQRIVLVAGFASQTGPEQRNVRLGEDRAGAVYDYLVAGLGTDQIDENVRSLGSSDPRPGFDHPGEEHPENRSVAVVLEIRSSMIASTPPPDPPQDPPPPTSRQWELGVTAVLGVSDPIPGIDIVGGQVIEGTLRNVRTGDERQYRIVAGGFELGLSASPVEIGVNTQMNQLAPFATHWAEFDDFNFSMVFIIGVNAADVAEASSASILIPSLNTHVEPNTLTIKTNISASAQYQVGVFYFTGY